MAVSIPKQAMNAAKEMKKPKLAPKISTSITEAAKKVGKKVKEIAENPLVQKAAVGLGTKAVTHFTDKGVAHILTQLKKKVPKEFHDHLDSVVEKGKDLIMKHHEKAMKK